MGWATACLENEGVTSVIDKFVEITVCVLVLLSRWSLSSARFILDSAVVPSTSEETSANRSS